MTEGNVMTLPEPAQAVEPSIQDPNEQLGVEVKSLQGVDHQRILR